MNRYFLFLFGILGPVSAFSQYQMGMRLERQAGLYSTAINPAALAFTPARWEVSLFEADVFGNQNYARLYRNSVPKILRNEDFWTSLEAVASNPGTASADQLRVDYLDRGHAFGQFQTRVSGPGFALKVAPGHSAGLSVSGRYMLSLYRVPNVLRYAQASAFDYGQTYRISPFSMATMAWTELNGHYAYHNFDGDLLFSVGVTPKWITGIQAAYMRMDEGFDFTPVAKDTLNIATGNWEAGFTTDIAYAADPAQYRPQVNGMGAGLDIGVSWAMPKEDAVHESDYLWRAGVSLIDLGAVSLRKNAEAHRYDFDQLAIVRGTPLDSALQVSPQAGVQQLSALLLGDPNVSLVQNKFVMGLPTVLSAQFDYSFTSNIYVQGVVLQRLPLYRHALKSPNTVALVPRFEHRWFSASLPLVLSDYRSLRMGLGARLGVLYIGSDDLGSWVGKRSLTGSDVYVALKVDALRLKGKKRSNRGGLRQRDRRWRDVGCYNQ